MVHTGIFATKAEIDVKVGELVDVTGYTEININNACKWAEALICLEGKKDFVTTWASLNAVARNLLSETEAILVAISFISYNTKGYPRIEAETTLDVRWAEYKRNIELIENQDIVKIIMSGF